MAGKTNIAVVPVGRSLDVRQAASLKRLIQSLSDQGCRRIMLNFAQTDYVDSAGMGMLFGAVRRMRESGGLLSCTNVSPRVMRIFSIYRLVDYAPVQQTGERPRFEELDPQAQPISHNVLRVEGDNLQAARGRVEELLRHLGFEGDRLFDMTLAVGEAMGNAVDHTEQGGVLATVTGYPDRAIVDVSDCGAGFELASDEEPVSSVDAVERGRGIKLMRLLADSVSIHLKRSGQGTVVRLVKLLR